VTVAPVTVSGGVTGGIVKQTSPLMIVCGAVFELVKVLEATPYVAVVPSGGAVAAIACEATKSSAANPRLASELR
jgi:hypothetical protein